MAARKFKKTALLISVASILGISNSAWSQTVVYGEDLPNSMINVNSGVNAGAGDGFGPIPFKDRIYVIGHHIADSQLNQNQFKCILKDASTNGCDGFGSATGDPRVFVQPLLDGDPLSNLNSTTSSANEEYAIIGDRFLYYPVTRFPSNAGGSIPQDWGFACFDLSTNQECGTYNLLSSNPNNRTFEVGVEGPFQVGNKLYFVDLEMNIYCREINPGTGTATACLTPQLDLYSHPGTLLPRYTSSTGSWVAHIGGEVVGSKLFLTVNYNNPTAQSPTGTTVTDLSNAKYGICLDLSAGISPCWSAPVQFQTSDHVINRSNFIAYDTSMNPESLCTFEYNNQMSCIALFDGSNTTGNWTVFSSSINTQRITAGSSNPLLMKETTIGSETYFAGGGQNDVYCYNWQLQTSCASAPYAAPNTISPISIYAVEKDEANCIWVYGHHNNLWSLDPVTRFSPCSRGTFRDLIEEECERSSWFDFQLLNFNPADYAELKVEIMSSSGWVTFDLLASSTVDLSTTNFATLSSIEYKITATFASGLTEFSSTPRVEIQANEQNCDGSTLKVCKVAGPGVDIGTEFNFGATWGETGNEQISNLTDFVVPAGPAPGGYCQIGLTGLDPSDQVVVGEYNRPGYRVTDIAVEGGGTPSDISISGRNIWFNHIGEGVTEVTFTNEKYSGYLEICKKGNVDGDFTFQVRNQDTGEVYPDQIVPANACSPALEVTAGNISITEIAGPGEFLMTGCETIPSTAQNSCDPAFNTTEVSVIPGGIAEQTIAIVENCPAIVGPNGRKICFLEGTGEDIEGPIGIGIGNPIPLSNESKSGFVSAILNRAR